MKTARVKTKNQKGSVVLVLLTGVLAIVLLIVVFIKIYPIITHKPNVLTPSVVTNVMPQPTENVNNANATPQWKLFTNTKYNYIISYLDTYSVDKSDGKPGDPTTSPEIHFSSNDTGFGFSIKVWANPDNITPKAYFINEMAQEQKDQADCIKQNTGKACMPVTLKDLAKTQSETTLKGLSAYKFSMFKFDHSDECYIVTKNQNFYQLCFDNSDPNDPDIEQHVKIYNEMLQSFNFL